MVRANIGSIIDDLPGYEAKLIGQNSLVQVKKIVPDSLRCPELDLGKDGHDVKIGSISTHNADHYLITLYVFVNVIIILVGTILVMCLSAIKRTPNVSSSQPTATDRMLLTIQLLFFFLLAFGIFMCVFMYYVYIAY